MDLALGEGLTGIDPEVGRLVFVVLVALLAVGTSIRHHQGAWPWLADVWIFSPYLFLAVGWWGGGALLIITGHAIAAPDSTALVLLGGAIGALGLVAWFIGIVGIVWLPRRLRPQWLQERMKVDPGRMRVPHRRRVRRR